MFREYVDKNLTLLEGKTSDLHPLLNLLVENDIISGNERDDIDEEGTDAKKAKKLWNILKKKDDEDVPKIIFCLSKTKCAKAVSECLARFQPDPSSIPTSPTTPTGDGFMHQQSLQGGGDFVVEKKHVHVIAATLNKRLNPASWELIKRSWLPQEIINEVGTQANMKLDIIASFSVWVDKTGRAQKLYSKIIDAVRGESVAAAEELEDIQGELKAMA